VGKLHEAVGPPCLLAVHIQERIELLDLGGNAHFVSARVEAGNGADARAARAYRFPGYLCVITDRRYHADAGDCHASRHRLPLPIPATQIGVTQVSPLLSAPPAMWTRRRRVCLIVPHSTSARKPPT